MPHHEEGYISKHIETLMRDRSGRPVCVLDFAQCLHELTTGGSEASGEEEAKAAEVVKFYLDHWLWTAYTSVYDCTVHTLLTSAFREYEDKKHKEKNSTPSPLRLS